MKRRALFQWASNVVGQVADRSKRLVQRVLKADSLVCPESLFEETTAGLDHWSETSIGATNYNTSICEGLDCPKWKRTIDLHTDKVIESRPIDGDKHAMIDCALPPGVTDIKSTVWFGKVKNDKNRPTRFKKNSRRI